MTDETTAEKIKRLRKANDESKAVQKMLEGITHEHMDDVLVHIVAQMGSPYHRTLYRLLEREHSRGRYAGIRDARDGVGELLDELGLQMADSGQPLELRLARFKDALQEYTQAVQNEIADRLTRVGFGGLGGQAARCVRDMVGLERCWPDDGLRQFRPPRPAEFVDVTVELAQEASGHPEDDE